MVDSVKKLVRLFAIIAFFMTFLSYTSAIRQDEIEYELRKDLPVRKPRFVRIYSKPPGDDAEKKSGLKFHEHLKNALHGGSVGMEFDFKPLKNKISGWYDTVHKYLSSKDQPKNKYHYQSKTLAATPSKDKGTNNDIDSSIGDYSDEDYIIDGSKSRSGEKVPKNEEISAEFVLDPRMQVPPGPKKLVDLELERERLEEY